MRIPVLLIVLPLLVVASCKSGSTRRDPTDLPVTVHGFPAMTVLVRQYRGPYELVDDNFENFILYLEKRALVPQGPLMCVFLDDPEKVGVSQTRYELRIPVRPGTAAEQPFRVTQTKSERHAMILVPGSYEKVAANVPDVLEWVGENGWRTAGPVSWICIRHSGAGVPAEEYETEIHVPVVK